MDIIIVPTILGVLTFIISIMLLRLKSKRIWKIVLFAFSLKMIVLSFRILLLLTIFGQRADTVTYYRGGVILYDTFKKSPEIAFEIIFNKIENLSPKAQEVIYNSERVMLQVDHSPGIVTRTAGFLSLLCYKSFIGISMLFTFLGFIGQLLIYLRLISIYRFASIPLVFLFFIPTILFWGAMISKDSLMLFGLGLSFYGLIGPIVKKGMITRIISVIIGGIILLKIKAYVLLTLIVCYMLVFLLKKISRLSKYLRLGVIFFIIPVFLISILSLDQVTRNIYPKASLAGIQHRSETLIVGTDKGESQYRITGFSTSPTGYLFGGIGAIVTTYFRPFIWETRKIIYLPSVIEGLFSFFLLLFIWAKTGLSRRWRVYLKGDFVLLFCILFSILFGVLTGLFSLTFGSLVRYKMPALLFFYISILLIYSKSKMLDRKNLSC